MQSLRILFTRPYYLELESRELGPLHRNEILVKTRFSAVSHGTELLVYNGQFPDNIPLDSDFNGAGEPIKYPLSYGYSVIGEVTEKGSPEIELPIGQRVFAFKSHQNYFTAEQNEIIPVPEGIDFRDALFFPNMETAVNLIMDAKPMIGESIAVIGQGTVGLLVTALISRFPLSRTLAVDLYKSRLLQAGRWGAEETYCPEASKPIPECHIHSYDLVFEVTGNPQALDSAISLCRPGGRIIIGSFYGKKRYPVNLGDTFHRSRIRIYPSQVSSIAPEHSLCWNKDRRSRMVWDAIKEIKPKEIISHCFDFTRAAEVYKLIQNDPEVFSQVIFEYPLE